jgi:hypothetical protein
MENCYFSWFILNFYVQFTKSKKFQIIGKNHELQWVTKFKINFGKSKKPKEWKGFIIESYKYINPKGFIAHLKFFKQLPKAWFKFHFLCA